MKTKSVLKIVLCVLITIVSVTAFAELVEPTPEEWGKVLVSVTSGQLSVLAVVAAVVQACMLVLRTRIGEGAGRLRLVLVSLLTVVGGVLGLRSQGMEWGSSLVHSSVLAAAQVFMYDLYKYLKPDQVVPAEGSAAKRKAKR